MNKRAISPLILTVLIIAFTVALASLIIAWGGGLLKISDADAKTTASEICESYNFEEVDEIKNVGGKDYVRCCHDYGYSIEEDYDKIIKAVVGTSGQKFVAHKFCRIYAIEGGK